MTSDVFCVFVQQSAYASIYTSSILLLSEHFSDETKKKTDTIFTAKVMPHKTINYVLLFVCYSTRDSAITSNNSSLV